MRCPRCGYPLEQHVSDRVEIDACGRCGGMFYDAGEIATELGSNAGPEHWVESHLCQPLGDTGMRCPRDGAILRGFNLSLDQDKVEVDACARCKGLWLDRGEHEQLRGIIAADAQKQEQANIGGIDKKYFFMLLFSMPLEVYNPVRRRAWATWLFALSLLAVFAIELTLGEDFVIRFSMVPKRLFAGEQWWGLFTSMLLHAGWLHLIGNSISLLVFGDNVEDRLGWWRLIKIACAAHSVGMLMQAISMPSGVEPVLGASAAIAGIMGAYLVFFGNAQLWYVFFFVRFKLKVSTYLLIWIGFNVVAALAGQAGVAWYAHVGGFATGALMGWIYRRQWQQRLGLTAATAA